MRTIIFITTLVLLNVAFAQIIPCGRCVPKGEVCNRDTCLFDLKCTARVSQPGAARICMPVTKRNQSCEIKEYDPCETGFACIQTGLLTTDKTCQPTSRYAGLGDNCMSSLYCENPLVCNGGVCSVPTPGQCTTNRECKFNQYCKVDFTTIPFTGACAAVTAKGGNCSETRSCEWGAVCDENDVCSGLFSRGEGGDCSRTASMCKPGLYCGVEQKCIKPPYHLLLGIGSAWGPPCIPTVDGATCTCNQATFSYQQLKESSFGASIARDICPTRYTEMGKCLSDKGCSDMNLGADTCTRRNCFEQYKALVRDCGTIDGVEPFCGANSLIVLFLLVVLALLI